MNQLKDGYVYEIIVNLDVDVFSQGNRIKVLSHQGDRIMICDCSNAKLYEVSERALALICKNV